MDGADSVDQIYKNTTSDHMQSPDAETPILNGYRTRI